MDDAGTEKAPSVPKKAIFINLPFKGDQIMQLTAFPTIKGRNSNGHMDNPYCEGIQGAMAAYAHSLRTVKFHGPTNFAPIINTVARRFIFH
ncbi:unnamed protein product [Trichobilharzia regenti]|nr:unnamed protein product [Trichobilharzia regenti]